MRRNRLLRNDFLVVFLATVGIGVGSPALAQTSYNFTQIDQGFSPAMDVNDSGAVVGWWSGPNQSQGYVWTKATGPQPIITDPATVALFPFYTGVNDPSRPLRINVGGTIVGVGCFNGCGFTENRAAIWKSSQGLVFLGSFDHNQYSSAAAGVNGSEQVVGFSGGGGFNTGGPFIWSAETGLQPLAGFLGVNGNATAINGLGQVVGVASTGTRAVAFIWSAADGYSEIPDLPDASTDFAFAINDAGVVVGRATLSDNSTVAVRWSTATGVEDLHAPPGFIELMDINNAGDIVATIATGQGRVPYLYRDGVWTDLNDLLPAGVEFRLQFVEAINNLGWIVGAGTTSPPTELLQGFVLAPVRTATQTSLSVTPGSSVFGQPVQLQANVTSNAGSPTGDVEFFDGNLFLGSRALSTSGVATMTTSALSIGSHTLSAKYSGDSAFLPGDSNTVVHAVAKAQTTTTLSSAPNPSLRRQTVTITAVIAAVSPGAGTPTGTVQLFEGKKRIGSAVLVSGVATFHVAFTSAGQHSLKATYAGDGHFLTSTSAVLTQVVRR